MQDRLITLPFVQWRLLALVALVAALLSQMAAPVAAQQSDQKLIDPKSEEFQKLDEETKAEIFRQQANATLIAIQETAPERFKGQEYVFSSSDDLQADIQMLEAVRADLQVGGRLRDMLQVLIANSNDLVREIKNDPDLTADLRQELISDFEGDVKELTAVRTRFDDLSDIIRQFTQVEAPAIKRLAKYKKARDRNAAVIREFGALDDALRGLLGVLNKNEPPKEGSD